MNREFWFERTPEYFNVKFQLLTYAIDAIFILYSQYFCLKCIVESFSIEKVAVILAFFCNFHRQGTRNLEHTPLQSNKQTKFRR